MFGPALLHSIATSSAFASGAPSNRSSSSDVLHMPPLATLEAMSDETPTRLTLQTFHKVFGEREVELTASIVNGEPWFRGKEAAAALGYKHLRAAIHTHVDEEDLT